MDTGVKEMLHCRSEDYYQRIPTRPQVISKNPGVLGCTPSLLALSSADEIRGVANAVAALQAALHYIALHCTALHCTALHCTALH